MIDDTFKKIQAALDQHEKDSGAKLVKEPGIYEFSCGVLDVDIDTNKVPSCELRLSGGADVFAVFWNAHMKEDKIQHYSAIQLRIIEAFFNKKIVIVKYSKAGFLGIRRKTSAYAIQTGEGFTDFHGKAILDISTTTPV